MCIRQSSWSNQRGEANPRRYGRLTKFLASTPPTATISPVVAVACFTIFRHPIASKLTDDPAATTTKGLQQQQQQLQPSVQCDSTYPLQYNYRKPLTMKITALALLTVFAATSSAFGLNGAAQSAVKSTQSIGLAKKSALVQPMDIHGNRLNSVVSNQ